MRIGLFSLKSGVGCTSISIHIANFLASDKNNKVALRETAKESKFRTAKTEFAEDGTFLLNDVHYYPSSVDIKPTEAFVIDDIGTIGILFKFDTGYDKLYLCTDGSDSDLEAFLSYKEENDVTADVLLFGGSKECVHKWQEATGFRVVLIGRSREKRIAQNLAMAFSTFLRVSGVVPPVYKADAIYAPIVFGDGTEEDEAEAEETVDNKEKEPVPFSVKSFVKVPEPTDVYVGAREKDDGKGIIQTEIGADKDKDRDKDKESVENEVASDIQYEDDEPKKRSKLDVVKEKFEKEKVVKGKEAGKKPEKKEEPEHAPEEKAEEKVEAAKKASDDIVYEDEGDEKKSFFSDIANKIPKITLPFGKKKPEIDVPEGNVWDSSLIGDIPMDCVDFSFDKMTPCKDIAGYAIFVNKKFRCIGLKKNVHKSKYDNTDKSLLNLTKADDGILQFFSEDLLSGDYTLRRFEAEEIYAMRVYFDFMCHLFEREISKTVTLREYVEFKQYYNRLCETKLMLDTEENERRRIIHDIYLRYQAYTELYNVETIDEAELINENVDPFVTGLKVILNEHICDEDVKIVIKGLIDEVIAVKRVPAVPEPAKEEPKPEVVETEPEPEVAAYVEPVDTEGVSPAFIGRFSKSPYRLMVMCFKENGDPEDRASYGLVNIERAVYTYMRKEAFVKQLLLVKENSSTLLYSSKNGGVIVPAKGDFDDDALAIKDQIEKLMSEF